MFLANKIIFGQVLVFTGNYFLPFIYFFFWNAENRNFKFFTAITTFSIWYETGSTHVGTFKPNEIKKQAEIIPQCKKIIAVLRTRALD
jgi:hypothetical protein